MEPRESSAWDEGQPGQISYILGLTFCFFFRRRFRKNNLVHQQGGSHYDGTIGYVKSGPLVGTDIEQQEIGDVPCSQTVPEVADRPPRIKERPTPVIDKV